MSAGLPSPKPSRLTAYAVAVLAVLVATITTTVIYQWIEPSTSLLFFPAVVLPAMYGGYGPALLSTVLSMLSLAYFLIPPRYSFDIGIDDYVRLAVFALMAVATAWLSSGRRRAEASLQRSLQDLQGALATLRKVGGWPVLIGADTAASIERMLTHAANVVGARNTMVGWESEEEPWLYIADRLREGEVVTKHPPADLHALVTQRYGESGLVSAEFHTEHLSGRVFFTDVDPTGTDLTAVVELVAREVGNSLDQLYVAERLRQLAVREDRLRLSRDLHDGVLQSLTGIRLELQAIAEEREMPAPTHDRLLAIERAIAIEQRELRLFIEELKPTGTAPVRSGPIAQRLDDMCARLSAEWKTPITLRVHPPELALPETIEQAIRLMVHEAVVNALKHAHPSRVAITLDAVETQLRISVADDGRGFPFRGRLDHEQLIEKNAGPASLRDRVTALDGRMSVESSPSGSRVEFVLPVAHHFELRSEN
jgi:signal transduction histidine kinase